MKNHTIQPCVRTRLASVPTPTIYIYHNAQAIRQLLSELEAPIVTRALSAIPAGDQWNRQNYIANILPTIDPRVPAAHVALDVLAKSPEFIEAKAIIEPLIAELAELEIVEQTAREDLADKQRAHAFALALAQEKALAAAENDPAVKAAAAALAAVA